MLLFLVVPAFVLISFRASRAVNDPSIGVQPTVDYFVANTATFTQSTQELLEAVRILNSDRTSVLYARKKLAECRLSFKRVEFFTDYFFRSETRLYNAAPVFEVEEPTLELVEPMGLQQIESLLYEADVLANQPELVMQAEALHSSVRDLKTLLYQFEATDAQILESLRIELIRIMALSLSGYDAPLLKSGVREATEATKSLHVILQPYLRQEPIHGPALHELLLEATKYLAAHPDFDTFDRLGYFTRFALPLQKKLGQLIRALNLDLNTTQHLNHQAEHLFSPDAFKNLGPGTRSDSPSALDSLGKMLFSDKVLSGPGSTSCASCHQPDKYFSDNLTKSPSLHPDSTLKRNTPSLLYAGRQHLLFWEGRAASLEEQIKEVLFNPLEMGSSAEVLAGRIRQQDAYRPLFRAAFPHKAPAERGVEEVAAAIAAYLGSLAPMNSPFDRYLRGDEKALTDAQINGFNLFMGKAQCGTCHFIPYFNSLLPPLYDVSEVEVLGTPANDDPDRPRSDRDPGRYALFQMRYYRGAFKTPTVRNAAKTAPYMHNGAFASLHSVMEFYNRGGGRGLGLATPDQTLPAQPLGLTATEIEHLIAFIDSLTDSLDY
ncbi:cytochrome c peroxidase [Rhabdobacter roseus]